MTKPFEQLRKGFIGNEKPLGITGFTSFTITVDVSGQEAWSLIEKQRWPLSLPFPPKYATLTDTSLLVWSSRAAEFESGNLDKGKRSRWKTTAWQCVLSESHYGADSEVHRTRVASVTRAQIHRDECQSHNCRSWRTWRQTNSLTSRQHSVWKSDREETIWLKRKREAENQY